ncbi:MAG: hypothetical protein M1825_003769 [Sarcosagium campestre]|nr:MAG: hypothetical protein M1825_003769 [Sarcosagium campestre]
MLRHCSLTVASLALLPTILLSTPATGIGILDTIPTCYQDCITKSGDFTCNGLDIKCLCRLSNGNFLTNVITCIRSNCDNSLDTSQLVGPVAETCKSAGVPIAPAAIANAKSIGAALATTEPLTGATTITSTLASAGTSYEIAVPLSVKTDDESTRTITGKKSTITQASIGLDASESGSDRSSESTSTTTATTSTVTSTATAEDTATSSSTVTEGGAAQAGSVSGAASEAGATAGATAGANGGTPFGNGASSSSSVGWGVAIGMAGAAFGMAALSL